MRAIISLFLAFVMAITLVACGGANSDNKSLATPDNSEDQTPVGESPAVEQPVIDENTLEPDVSDGTDEQELAKTIDIKLEVEGNVETREGKLVVSDNGYYLYTLPQYIFTPEEPNVDMVYMDKFEDFNMRIISLGSEFNLEEVRVNAEEELRMLGDVVELTGKDTIDPTLRDSATFYLHSFDSTLSKDIIVREIEGVYYKIIISMPNSEAQEGAGPSFAAMATTIQLTNP